MQLTERDTVAYNGLALGIAVRRDVRRVQELLMTQTAQGTSFGISPNYSLTKCDLV